jgi:hypothetical protein
MKIERFEDVKAWQIARELTKLVYEVTASGAFARDFRLVVQPAKSSRNCTSPSTRCTSTLTSFNSSTTKPLKPRN